MSITIIVGGQFGSEGKGKVASFLSKHHYATAMVRCGGPNSGHTVYPNEDSEKHILQQLPSGVVDNNCRLLIPAGGYVDPYILAKEVYKYNVQVDQLGIDYNTTVITSHHVHKEDELNLNETLGSTCSGTGAAVSDRVLRNSNVTLAKEHPVLKKYTTDVAQEICTINKLGGNIIIEGTQGFGLSLYHSPYYPFTTSRDTTASGFASEVGVSPFDITTVVMVIRSHPIRVAGHSGPLPNETTWDDLKNNKGIKKDIEEKTSVTNMIRRVGEFDMNLVKQAVRHNKPNLMFLNHVDLIDPEADNPIGVKFSKDVQEFKDKLLYVTDINEKHLLLGYAPYTSAIV